MCCKHEADLCGKPFFNSEVFSIMIGTAESDFRFQLLIIRTDLIYKIDNLILIKSTLPILLHSVKNSFHICGEFVVVSFIEVAR